VLVGWDDGSGDWQRERRHRYGSDGVWGVRDELNRNIGRNDRRWVELDIGNDGWRCGLKCGDDGGHCLLVKLPDRLLLRHSLGSLQKLPWCASNVSRVDRGDGKHGLL
jgi:hypothetical protein